MQHLIDYLNEYANDINQPIFSLNNAFSGFSKKLEELSCKVVKPDDDVDFIIDRRFIGVEGDADKLVQQAIGCTSRCPMCGRKCELKDH